MPIAPPATVPFSAAIVSPLMGGYRPRRAVPTSGLVSKPCARRVQVRPCAEHLALRLSGSSTFAAARVFNGVRDAVPAFRAGQRVGLVGSVQRDGPDGRRLCRA